MTWFTCISLKSHDVPLDAITPVTFNRRSSLLSALLGIVALIGFKMVRYFRSSFSFIIVYLDLNIGHSPGVLHCYQALRVYVCPCIGVCVLLPRPTEVQQAGQGGGGQRAAASWRGGEVER